MEDFEKISVLLSLYGVFKEFRPSEPYLAPYLTSPPLNFTYEQVSQEIYPVSTYSTLIFLIIVFLITDYLRYKIVIIVQAVCTTVTYLMLIFCRGVFEMQLMQVVYGMYLAGEVAYFTYLYAKVETGQFQEVTSYTRSAHLVGKSLSGVVAQLVLYFEHTYLSLFWITVGSGVVSLIWAIQLPSVDKNMYFHRHSPGQQTIDDTNTNVDTKNGWRVVVGFLWTDLKAGFTNTYVIKWTTWWVLASGGYYMFISYAQLLWDTVRKESGNTGLQLNGVVEFSFTLLESWTTVAALVIGALGSILVGRVKWDWRKLGEPLLSLCSLAIAGLMYIMSASYSVYVAYVTYIASTTIFQIMITVANSEVAKNVNRESYGLIFGITTFALYIVLSLFTYIMLQVFQLRIRAQFEVYAIYYCVLGLCFGVTVGIRAL